MLHSVSILDLKTQLTKREKDVLYLISEECTNKEISELLFISMNTVQTHRKNIIQKLDVKNTAGIIRKSFERGILPMNTPPLKFTSTLKLIRTS